MLQRLSGARPRRLAERSPYVRVALAAMAFWSVFVVINCISAVLRDYDYRWVNVPLDVTLVLYCTALSVLIFRLAEHLSARPFAQQAAAAAGSLFVTAFLFGAGFHAITAFLGPNADRLTLATALTMNNIVHGGLFWFFPLCLWAAAVLALLHNRESRRRERLMLAADRELALSETKAVRAELIALRLQLNPHFLCNSLNAVSGLIVSGKAAEANEVVDSLATFLRHAAETSDRDTALDEEIEIVEAYLDVESVRFQPRLAVAFDCDPATLDALVPNFILQPLVENAVKYALASASTRVAITISSRVDGGQLLLSVTDEGDAPAPRTNAAKAGIGLANTRKRLALRFGADATLEAAPTATGFKATIHLPFVAAQARREDAPAAFARQGAA